MAEDQSQNISVKVPDDVLKGSYANNMFVSHTKEEFILDFVNLSFFPPPGQGIVNAKIVTTPEHIKRIIAALQDNVKKYEEKFGAIGEVQKLNENPKKEPSPPNITSEYGYKI